MNGKQRKNGPRRLAGLGPTEISLRLDLGSETAVYSAYSIIEYCRRLGYWTPFSLPAIKGESKKSLFPWPIHNFDDLRDAGYVERFDPHVRRREMEPLYRVTPRFTQAIFTAKAPVEPKPSIALSIISPIDTDGQQFMAF